MRHWQRHITYLPRSATRLQRATDFLPQRYVIHVATQSLKLEEQDTVHERPDVFPMTIRSECNSKLTVGTEIWKWNASKYNKRVELHGIEAAQRGAFRNVTSQLI